MNDEFYFQYKNRAGKKFTIKGGEQTEKGILSRAADDMIKLSNLRSESSGLKITQRNKPVTVVFSIFAIYNNEIIDLLSKDPNDEELEEQELSQSEEFRKFYAKSRDRLKSIGQGEQSIRRLHIVYKFSIYNNDTGKSKGKDFNTSNGGLFSTVTFVHCADFCKAKMPEFVILGDYLKDIATRKDSNIMEVPAYTNSRLINHINDSLNSGKDNSCVLLCNISGSYDYFSQSIDCLQFCANIKERIDNYYEDINAFNQDQEMINQLASPNSKSFTESQFHRKGNSSNAFAAGEGGSFRNSQEGFNQQEELIHVKQRDATYQYRRQRGQNPSAGEIQQDLSNLFKDIYSFTDQTHGLTEDEIRDWADDRETELKSILNDIQKLSPDEQRQFETVQYKIQEALNFLQQIKKNAAELAKNRSTNGDLGQMMNQYSKSRENYLQGSRTQDELDQDGQAYENNKQGGKRSMKNLKEQILNKIEELINDNELSRRTVRVGSMGGRDNRDGGDFSLDKQNRSLRQLKEMVADLDYMMQEKKQKLKQRNQDLKDQQIEIRNSLQHLEKEVKEKDSKIQYLEDQKEQLMQEIEREREIIQIKMDKEEQLEQNDEELRALINRIKVKLLRRKEECSMLKENIQKVEKEIYIERLSFEDERNSLVNQLNNMTSAFEDQRIRNQDIERINENFSNQIEDQERLIKKLQDDLEQSIKRYDSVQIMFQEEQNLNKELKINQTVYLKRIDEAEDRAQQFELKFTKLKRQALEEQHLIVEEKEQELQLKKEAVARLKIEVRELEKTIQELNQNSKILKIDNQKLQTFNEEIQRDLSVKRGQVQDLSQQLEDVSQEYNRLKNIQRESLSSSSNDQYYKKKLLEENDILNLNLRKSENMICSLKKDLEDRTIQVEQLKRDLIMTEDQKNCQKSFISQLERQNQYQSNVSNNSAIERLELKIRQLNQELQILRKENKELRQNNHENSMSLNEFKMATDRQSDKLNKNKHTIKNLTTQLDQMDEKVRELVHEKDLELSHVHSQPNYLPSSNLSNNKVNESAQRSGQTSYRNILNQQQRSILKKPRFNLADSDSDDSDDSDI